VLHRPKKSLQYPYLDKVHVQTADKFEGQSKLTLILYSKQQSSDIISDHFQQIFQKYGGFRNVGKELLKE